MSSVLSYGYKLPATGDRGSTWFANLEDNITRLNQHSHNGTDSPLLTSSAFTATSATALAVDWVLQSAGTYRQTITLPGGLLFAEHTISFRHGTTGHIMYLSCEKVNATQFYLYINDNTIPVLILYGA